ncbi:MAG: Queuine tRNA-ribosyltransferase [Candidatus Yanofskybacteria bacterium GW2011_GWF1_44_227]|nr:MAG: Queuine tRNA-ribosyltransferase [Candidatus Yanofskybacteria bacterium GW2011_GWF1_44_227]
MGVGKIADIFEAVENGVDTFDCVIPTREARHGKLYIKTGYIDIRKGKYNGDKKIIEKGCGCFTCSKVTRAQIRELIKSPVREKNAVGQRWCLMHNMWFFNKLLEDIRKSISKGRFSEFKDKTLARLS